MRIALCLSGQTRAYREGFRFYETNLLNKHDVDVFVHTWDCIEALSAAMLYKATGHIGIDRPLKAEHFKDYKVVDERWPAVNTFSMWYSVFKANEYKREHELRNGFRYDVVVRSRFDFALNRELQLPIEQGRLYVPNDLIKGHIEPNQLAANDQFAYGDSNVMDLYCQTFWNIDRAYKLGVPVNGEDMLSGNLQLTGLAGSLVYIDMNHPFPPGKYNSTPHSLIRDDFYEWNKLRG